MKSFSETRCSVCKATLPRWPVSPSRSVGVPQLYPLGMMLFIHFTSQVKAGSQWQKSTADDINDDEAARCHTLQKWCMCLSVCLCALRVVGNYVLDERAFQLFRMDRFGIDGGDGLHCNGHCNAHALMTGVVIQFVVTRVWFGSNPIVCQWNGVLLFCRLILFIWFRALLTFVLCYD